jgi:hypothetical protein
MSLQEGIRRLILKRKKLEPFSEEMAEVNVKLNKLYDCYWLMLEQENR